jgi:hypothetical protein
MKYRMFKLQCWWSELFDTDSPSYLFYDKTLKRYRVGSRNTANKHKWEFSGREINELRATHPGFDEEFCAESVK